MQFFPRVFDPPFCKKVVSEGISIKLNRRNKAQLMAKRWSPKEYESREIEGISVKDVELVRV